MSTLAITRKTANTLATAAGMNTNYTEIEAVVNALTSDNLSADSVTKTQVNSDVVRSGYGLVQHTDGSLYVDVSDTNPSLEISDGGLRAKVYGVINRTSDGLTWGRTGDVILSSSTSTPDGFFDVSATYANKFIRISATALSTGGSDTHTHTTSNHTHTGTTAANGSGSNGTTGGSVSIDSHTHTFTTSSGGSETLTGDNVPAYVTLKAYQKS
jgi:hypothetical protein